MKNLHRRIVALREEKGMSLSQLARESGISKSILHRLEKDDSANPEMETLQKIARTLKVTVGDLLGKDVVKNVRQLPDERPEWLTKLRAQLKRSGKEPDEDFLEALYVLQNRKGQKTSSDEDWLFLYQSIERSFSR